MKDLTNEAFHEFVHQLKELEDKNLLECFFDDNFNDANLLAELIR